MERVLLETGAVSRRLECSPEWVRQLERTGRLPAFAITASGRRLFRQQDVEAFRLQRNRQRDRREASSCRATQRQSA